MPWASGEDEAKGKEHDGGRYVPAIERMCHDLP